MPTEVNHFFSLILPSFLFLIFFVGVFGSLSICSSFFFAYCCIFLLCLYVVGVCVCVRAEFNVKAHKLDSEVCYYLLNSQVFDPLILKSLFQC